MKVEQIYGTKIPLQLYIGELFEFIETYFSQIFCIFMRPDVYSFSDSFSHDEIIGKSVGTKEKRKKKERNRKRKRRRKEIEKEKEEKEQKEN